MLVLDVMDGTPSGVDEIARRLAEDGPLGGDALANIERALISLERSGLIESIKLA